MVLQKLLVKQGNHGLSKISCIKFSFASEKEVKKEANTEKKQEAYITDRISDFKDFYKISVPENNHIEGYATEEGTLKYSKRNKAAVSKNHFRTPLGTNLHLSSVGVSSYGLTYDEEEDKLLVFNSFIDTVQSGGCNIMDTSLNSMGMAGERTLGAAVRYLIKH